MKKKLLTTAAALAMLAPTMTSFASTMDTTISGLDTQIQTSNLEITGQVQNDAGQAPAGQISVTLPTKISFIVDPKGTFQAANTMNITNNSQVGIDVSVSAFSDTTPTSGKGITITSAVDGYEDQYDRSFMSLKLQATGGTGASLVELLSNGFTESTLVSLDPSTSTGLTLVGNPGTGDSHALNTGDADLENDGVQDTFTLTFKIAQQ